MENGETMETITLNPSTMHQMMIQGPNGEILQVLNLKDATTLLTKGGMVTTEELKVEDQIMSN